MKFQIGQKVCSTIENAKRSQFHHGIVRAVFANFAVAVAAGTIDKDTSNVVRVPSEELSGPWYIIDDSVAPESAIMLITSKIDEAIKSSGCGADECHCIQADKLIPKLEKIAKDESASLLPV